MKRTYLLLAALMVGFGCTMLAFDPAYSDILYAENNLIENLTVIIFGLTLILSLTLFFRNCRARTAYGFWAFMALALIIFIGDEISWGADYFGFSVRKVIGVNFDGVHDSLAVFVKFIKTVRDSISAAGLFETRSLITIAGSTAAIGFLIYMTIHLITKKKEKLAAFFSKNLKWEPFLFLFIALLLLFAAAFIDEDNLVSFPHKTVAEETLEFLASASLLFAGISGFKKRREA